MKYAEYRPLEWPLHRPRTSVRKSASFSKTVNNGKWNSQKPVDIDTALRRLNDQIQSLDKRYHTNYVLTTGGIGKSGRPISRVEDVGAAVYFKLFGNQVVLACDKWDRAADNIVALAKHIEALRGQERWGVATTKEAFAGHMALPAPMSGGGDWRAVMNFKFDDEPTADEINSRYRKMAKIFHSDKGGQDADMAGLNAARDAALNRLG